MIQVKRVYDEPARSDGLRVLVDRLWPRGVRKTALRYDLWQKEAAPSPELRRWFAHDPEKWAEFRRRYRRELEAHPDVLKPLLDAAAHGNLTLLYAARDRDHNEALVIKEYLERALASHGARAT
ncbi:MAG TPA: DUF488 domain-containing protein [Gemmatimonadales bacterium]|nr:DUF488 domain-containing protein [Gemmatimonadales bacterium]